QQMIQDPWFANELKCRWTFLRQNQLSVSRIHQYIDSMAVYLNEAQQRNFALWPVLGQNVYYNSFPYPLTFQAEIDSLKSWVARRMVWLDANWPGVCTSIGFDEASALQGIRIWPNPFTEQLVLRIPSSRPDVVTAQLTDLSGRTVQVFNSVAMQPGENEVLLKPDPDLPRGLYLLVVNTAAGSSVHKIVRE
ncbi:MAG: T9SS type A sorting domain-containing protein, partial [Bacteroidia bacterium]